MEAIVQAPQRLYCGNKNPVPPGYAGYDTRFSCLRKGVGIGLYKIRRDAQAGAVGNNGILPPPRVMVQQRLVPAKTWWSQVPWWGWAILLGLVVLVILILLLFFVK